MTTSASAPGKVILLGEHAAVYGNPVLVAAVDKRTYVTVTKRRDDDFILINKSTNIKNLRFTCEDIPKLKEDWGTMLTAECIQKVYAKYGFEGGLDIEIHSDIPVSSGMGSSASASAALVLAITTEFGKKIDKKEIADLSWLIENIVHGKSSGVDPYAVTFGGVLRYKKGEFAEIKLKKEPELTIGDTGVKADTSNPVNDVMKLKENYPKFFANYLEAMKHIVDYGQTALEAGDYEKLGEIMNINHGLLSSIGVSSPELEKLVWAARTNPEVLGSKLCGKGRGGIMLALGNAEKEIKAAGGKVIKTKITPVGVKIE
jgi:mevalonate kinase